MQLQEINIIIKNGSRDVVTILLAEGEPLER